MLGLKLKKLSLVIRTPLLGRILVYLQWKKFLVIPITLRSMLLTLPENMNCG